MRRRVSAGLTRVLAAAALVVAAAGAEEAPTNVHAFYYLWYGTPEVNGRWQHWDHEVLPHWHDHVSKQYPVSKRYAPPQDLHSPFYPQRGPYSSSDPRTLASQMRELKAAGVHVLVLSWWGPKHTPGTSDTQGVQTDVVLPIVIKVAEEEAMRVAFHLEPYPGRSATSVREDVKYLMRNHGNCSCLYRRNGLPVYYVYDSYHVSPKDWAEVLTPSGKQTLRGTSDDGIFIALWLNENDGEGIRQGGFDGFYTYFASEEVSWGASRRNWPVLARWAKRHGQLFVASVGPGYDDTRIRPWNRGATRPRRDGALYDAAWSAALAAGARVVSITSYNEWGEGTQIEPASAATFSDGTAYQDYGEGAEAPNKYMDLTRTWASKLNALGQKDEEQLARSEGASRSDSRRSNAAGINEEL